MKLVFISNIDNKTKFKLTSTPILQFDPYMQKFTAKNLTPIDYYIKLNYLDESIKTLYDLMHKSITDFCKDNGINSFTFNDDISFTLIKKEIVEFTKNKKELDAYCDACRIFGKITNKPKLVIPDLDNAFGYMKLSIWKQDDKLNIKSDNTDKLFDEDFYSKYQLILKYLNIPSPIISSYTMNKSITLVDTVLEELKKLKLESNNIIEPSKEVILDSSGNPVKARYLNILPGETNLLDIYGIKLNKEAVKNNIYLQSLLNKINKNDNIEIENKIKVLEEFAHDNDDLKKVLQNLKIEASDVSKLLSDILEKSEGEQHEKDNSEDKGSIQKDDNIDEELLNENKEQNKEIEEDPDKVLDDFYDIIKNRMDADDKYDKIIDEMMGSISKILEDHNLKLDELIGEDDTLSEVPNEELNDESKKETENMDKPKYEKKWVLFNVLSDDIFFDDTKYVNIVEYDVFKKDIVEYLISAINNKVIAPIISNDNLCILINIETSAYSGKTAIRQKSSYHNASYNGRSLSGAYIGPIIYAYGPNPTSGPFGSSYSGGDSISSHDGVYKSLHTMAYSNEGHIIHHNEINVLKPNKVKYNKSTDELIVMI